MDRSKIATVAGLCLLLVLIAGGLFSLWLSGWFSPPLIQRLEALVEAKKWKDAEDLLATADKSMQPEVRQIYLARIRIGQDRPDGALNALNKLPPQLQGSFAARIIAGNAHLKLGNASRALEAFDLAIQENPQDPEANRGLAAALYDLGALDQAFRLLVAYLKEQPDQLAFRHAGQIAKELGRTEEAATYLARALEYSWPAEPQQDLALNLLEVHLDRNDTERAQNTWDTWVHPLPDSANKAGLGGKLKMFQGRTDEAALWLDQARKLDPASPWIARLRGQVWLDQGKPAEAVPLLEFATTEDPLDTLAWNQKALALERLGLKDQAQIARLGLDKATANLKKMTELNQNANNRPADVQIRLELARLCLEVKRPQLAKVWEKSAREAALLANNLDPKEGPGKPK